MKTIYSPQHLGHRDQQEVIAGEIVPGFEKPLRAEIVKARVESERLGPVLAPTVHDLAAAKQVHRADYVEFLPTVWPLWQASGKSGTALPFTWPTRGLRGDLRPQSIDALLGYYSFDGGAGFVAGSWEAIKSSYDTVLTAASLVGAGEPAAFALCRPPGHHAGTAFMGGYCYLNNAAIAAQYLLASGARHVSILDVDYHHGNGTQEIFYERSDVQLINLHADPSTEYPFFLGAADEFGAGPGEGFNINMPMPPGTAWDKWGAALDHACEHLARYAPDVLVVSLGVDTFERDPISKFKLKAADYPKIGMRIAKLRLPTLFVMEGGYAVAEIGINAVAVLTAFEGS